MSQINSSDLTQSHSSDFSQSNAYVVEVDGQTVGIVARDGKAYRFHAAVHRFNVLDGRRFRSPQEAERAALSLRGSPPGRRPPRGRKLAAAAI